MANPELLEEQREETRLIIEELLEDGSDPDALLTPSSCNSTCLPAKSAGTVNRRRYSPTGFCPTAIFGISPRFVLMGVG